MINARPCSQHQKVPIVDVMLRASVSLWQAGISRTSNSMGNDRSEATFPLPACECHNPSSTVHEPHLEHIPYILSGHVMTARVCRASCRSLFGWWQAHGHHALLSSSGRHPCAFITISIPWEPLQRWIIRREHGGFSNPVIVVLERDAGLY